MLLRGGEIMVYGYRYIQIDENGSITSACADPVFVEGAEITIDTEGMTPPEMPTDGIYDLYYNEKEGLHWEKVAELTEEKQQLEVGMKQLVQKQDELEADNEKLLLEQKKLEKELRKMADSKILLERNVRAYDEDERWQLPEVGAFMSAKSYRDNRVVPLVSELKRLVKGLTIQSINAIEKEKQLKAKVNKLTEDVVFYKDRLSDYRKKVSELEKKAEDLEDIKKYVGDDEFDRMIAIEREQKNSKFKNQSHKKEDTFHK